MKTLLTILLLSVCSIAFGQPSKRYKKSFEKADQSITIASSNGITVTDDVRLNQLGLDRKIDLSKGEQFTEKEWQEYYRQMAPYVKEFFKRDSTHRKFLQNTIVATLLPGDTIQEYKISDDFREINLKLKPKKK